MTNSDTRDWLTVEMEVGSIFFVDNDTEGVVVNSNGRLKSYVFNARRGSWNVGDTLEVRINPTNPR